MMFSPEVEIARFLRTMRCGACWLGASLWMAWLLAPVLIPICAVPVFPAVGGWEICVGEKV